MTYPPPKSMTSKTCGWNAIPADVMTLHAYCAACLHDCNKKLSQAGDCAAALKPNAATYIPSGPR